MPRIVFVRPYIYTPSFERRVSTKFMPSKHPILVNEDCAAKALAVGAAVMPAGEVKAPRRRTVRKAPKAKAPRARRAKVIAP
jgi:hypothetical protein